MRWGSRALARRRERRYLRCHGPMAVEDGCCTMLRVGGENPTSPAESCSRCESRVSVVQSADPRKLDDATYRRPWDDPGKCPEGQVPDEGARLDGTRLRAVVGEGVVRPIRVVVAEKLMKRRSQVGLVPDDHVVETVATSRPDPALAVWVLPRRAAGREHFLDSEIADALSQERAVNAVAPVVSHALPPPESRAFS